MSTLSLPQPPSNVGQAHQETRRPYKYVPYDVLEIDWLGDPQRIINQSLFTDDKNNINNGQTTTTNTTNANNENNANDARYAPGTLVWVLLSKGKPKKQQPPTTSSANKKNAQHQQRQQQLEQGGYNALALHRKRRDKKNKRMLSSNNNNAKEGNNHQCNENKKDGSTNEETATTIVRSGDNNNSSNQSNENKKCKIDNSNNNNTATAINTTPLNQSRKEFFLRARVLTDDEAIPNNDDDGVAAAVDNDNNNDDDDDPSSSSSIHKRRMARRILVRYSKGSTYRVRAYNLIPILEPSVHYSSSSIDTTALLPLSMPLPVALQKNGEKEEAIHHHQQQKHQQQKQQSSQSVNTTSLLPPMVVLVPETNIYRRIAKVHATPDDSFMEIGCDYGITVDKIRTSLEDAGNVPKVWNPIPPPAGIMEAETTNKCGDDGLELEEEREEEGEVGKRVSCLGVDKSKESIGIANERYPKCKFSLGNILLPKEMSSIRTFCERSLVGSAPSIICIDVNGNREISGVLECLKMVMNESWKRQPRMIIVKSRFLYWELKKMGNGDDGGGGGM